MASIHSIKRRIKSIEGTRQITQAMELVSASKMVRAKKNVEKSRPYHQNLYQTLSGIASVNTDFSSEYTAVREVKKVCCVLIAGDRGLAGGYNSNLFKHMERSITNKNSCFFPLGKKSIEYCNRNNKEILTDLIYSVEDLRVGSCFQIGTLLANAFLNHKFDELYIAYTNFTSMLDQTPVVTKLLPICEERSALQQSRPSLIIYEPNAEAVFNAIVPSYLGGFLYGAVCEAAAAELAARRSAMSTASKNAKEMISDLNLHYNRVRQGKITQEITEIIAGSGE